MDNDESALLAQYGIKTESKLIYLYNEYRYESAKDAINFAKLEADRGQNSIASPEE